MEDQFEAAQKQLESLTERPTNEELLNIYGLYKQATLGDNLQRKPGMFDQKGQYKWKAWTSRKGMSTEEAMTAYVEVVDELLGKYEHA